MLSSPFPWPHLSLRTVGNISVCTCESFTLSNHGLALKSKLCSEKSLTSGELDSFNISDSGVTGTIYKASGSRSKI